MNPNKTEIIILLDSSGSMRNIKSDMEGALNGFIDDQKKDKNGECYVTLITFSNSYFVDKTGYQVHYNARPIQNVNHIEVKHNFQTALYDSLARAVDETGVRFAKMQEDDKPSNVIFVIITDGLENNSKRFTSRQVQKKIKHQTEIYNWNFIYLGANQDAFTVSESIGISAKNAVTYKPTRGGIKGMGATMSADVSARRAGSRRDCSLQSVYDREEKKNKTSS